MEQSRRTWLTSAFLLILLLVIFLIAGDVVFASSNSTGGNGQEAAGPKELSKLKKNSLLQEWNHHRTTLCRLLIPWL